MKKYIFLMILIALTGITFWSCSDDGGTTPEPENALTCNITAPLDSAGFYAGDSISVVANADDTDGTVIQVRFLLDENGVSSDDEFPYTAKIPTNMLAVGTHSIKAIAENAKGKEVSSIVDIGIIPNPPSNLTITQLNVYTFSLTWSDNSTGEDGFKLERKIDDGEFIEIAQTTENTYTDSTIMKKGFGSVYYQVKAYKEIYNSSYAENHAVVGFPSPTNFTYVKEHLSTIRFNWNDICLGEDGFKIDKKLGDSDWIIGFASLEENSETWIDSNVEINENIQYRLYAYKGTNTSSSVLNTIDNSIPIPSTFSVTQTTLTSATLTWNDNSTGEDKFEIERKLSTETEYIKIAEVTGSGTSSKTWIDTTVPNLIYDYRIKATYDIYTSDYTLYTFDNLFRAPSNLTLTQNNIYTIDLNWIDNSTGEEGYIIERKIEDNEWVSDYAVLAENTTGWIDTNLENRVKYSYRIYAYIGEYSSNYSVEESLFPIYDLIITEVMFNTSADENQDEFIELYNNTDIAIDLSGWSIADNAETDLLIKYHGFNDMILKPFSYCVVMDSSYYLNSIEYENLIPDSVLRVMINDGSIGQYGLSNSYNETVKLFNPDSVLTDSVTYDCTQPEGFSYERSSITNIEWGKSKIIKGTPGFKNSIMSKYSK